MERFKNSISKKYKFQSILSRQGSEIPHAQDMGVYNKRRFSVQYTHRPKISLY